MIGCIGVPPNRGCSGSLQVFNKLQSTVSDEIRDIQKLDISVDRKLANDGDYTSISSKVIGCELSHSSSGNLYMCFQVYFTSNSIRTEASHFVDMGILAVNASDEFEHLRYSLYKNQKSNRLIL